MINPILFPPCFVQVKHKYSAQMFLLFTEVFHCLPLAYCLGGQVPIYIMYMYGCTCVYRERYIGRFVRGLTRGR